MNEWLKARVLVRFRVDGPVLALLAATGFAHSASAETVEVAPGIQVTKQTYSAPANEQPFFGFAVKTDAQREEDDKFVKALLHATGTKEKALDEVVKRGWRALAIGQIRRSCTAIQPGLSRGSRTERRLSRPGGDRANPLQGPRLRRRAVPDRAEAAQSAEDAECGLRPRASGRQAAKGGAAGAGAGGQGARRISATPGSISPTPACKTATATPPARRPTWR